jgi:phosphoglycolate phosphatase-like HAD superfamily hydrolase
LAGRHIKVIFDVARITPSIYDEAMQQDRLFPQVKLTVKTLKELEIEAGLVTVASRKAPRPIEGHSLAHHCGANIMGDDGFSPKPAPADPVECWKRKDVCLNHAFAVGQSLLDILSGKKGQTLTIWVLSGMEGQK